MSHNQESNTEFLTRTAAKAAEGLKGHVKRQKKRYTFWTALATILTLLGNAADSRLSGGGHVTWAKFNEVKQQQEQTEFALEKRVEALETTNAVQAAARAGFQQGYEKAKGQEP